MSNVIEMFPNSKKNNEEQSHSYDEYKNLSGIINEQDYNSVLARLKNTTTIDETRKAQAKGIARFAGIELLDETKGVADPKIILYGILRSDVRFEGVLRHHDEMSDQRLFAEALRMLGDAESLKKMIEAYPNIYLGDDKNKITEEPNKEKYEEAA